MQKKGVVHDGWDEYASKSITMLVVRRSELADH